MNVRHFIGASSAALLVLLAGCGGKSSPEASPASSSQATSSACTGANLPDYNGAEVKVDTSTKVPTLTFPDTLPPKDLDVQVIEEGTGAQIGETDFLVVNYVGQVWCKKEPFDSSYSRDTPLATSLTQLVKGWSKGLVGHKTGAKLVINIPPGDLGYPDGQPSAGIGAGDTMAFYVEVLNSWSLMSAGQADAAVEKDKASLPVDYTGELGEPVTAMTPRDPQAEITEQGTEVIARGTGEPVGSTGKMYVAYYAMRADGQTAETTWKEGEGPRQIVLGSSPVFDSLVGVPVGSRVMLTIPASDGSGGNGSSGTATYAVVDILGYSAS